jgi:2-methylcitrate dehydratase PrpD
MDGRQATITEGRLVTRELAEWVAELRYEDLPDDVIEEAGRVFTDFLGECLFVGAMKPWGQAIARFAAVEGGQQPESTIIALGTKTLSSRAALANGTMALGFEFADFGAGSRPYPFAVPGPLALAESRRKSGRDLILAIAIGYEVMNRVTRATLPPSGTPFYVPSLYGTIGSAAACARLLGLSPQYTNFALGLGVAFTGGTFQGHEEGSWQRSLNGGMGGERGVTAALLAETGFRATELGLAGVQGFSTMYCGGRLDVSELLDGIGSSFCITSRWVKRFPMNTTLHAPVEALLNVMRSEGLHYTDIEQIDAAWQRVEPFLAKHDVATVVAAQASLPFALAVAAVRGRVGVDEFTEETLVDPAVRDMVGRTAVRQDAELGRLAKDSMPGRVTVRTKDGRTFSGEVLHPKGHPQNPLDEAEFKAKFMDMAERVLGSEQSEELYQRARELKAVEDVAELTPLFSPKQGGDQPWA